MTCQQAEPLLAQIADGRPAAELVAHARGCESCRRALEEALHQQAWLRQQFAEVSARLLAEAPVVTETMLRNRLETQPRPAFAGPLGWAVGFAAVALVAGAGIWRFTQSPQTTAQLASEQTAAGATALKEKAAGGAAPAVSSKRPPTTGKATIARARQKPLLRKGAVAKADSGDVAPPSAPEDDDMPPSGADRTARTARRASDARVYGLAPTGVLPSAHGSLVSEAQATVGGESRATILLSLGGLAANSVYSIATTDTAGQQATLARTTTDATGSAVVTLSAVPSAPPALPPGVPPDLVGPDVAATTPPTAPAEPTAADAASLPRAAATATFTIANTQGSPTATQLNSLFVLDARGNTVLTVTPESGR